MYSSNKMYIFLLCYLTASLSGMENIEKVQLPIIEGNIYIVHHKKYKLYAPQIWHDRLAQKITTRDVNGESIKPRSYICIPVIPVRVFIEGASDKYQQPTWYDWTRTEPPAISRLKQTKAVLYFPPLIPITWLHNAKTGTVLSFTVYNFYVQLTCCSNEYSNNTQKSFEEEFNIHIKGLQAKVPFCLAYDDQENHFFRRESKHIEFVDPAFFEQKLLKQKENSEEYEYGDKPFVSIEQLIIDHPDLFHQLYPKEYRIILLLLKVKQHYLQMADVSS